MNWTGQVQTSGDAVFQQIFILINDVEQDQSGDMRLEWAAGPGLHFSVDWTDHLTGTWTRAANMTAVSNRLEWTDEGDTNRPPVDQVEQRYYLLDAWP